MLLSETFSVPGDIALLYDFVNSLDRRRYVEQGVAHAPSDDVATPAQLETWLRDRDLLADGAQVGKAGHAQVLRLRAALRAFVQLTPAERAGENAATRSLNAVAGDFTLALTVLEAGAIALRPSSSSPASGLGHVLAQLLHLSETGQLNRLKLCDSEDCRWMFYDRSKPGNRRWCSSALCGNRQKTRTYRDRQRAAGA